MTTNINWLEHTQQKSAALSLCCFFASYTLQLYLCTLASTVASVAIQLPPLFSIFTLTLSYDHNFVFY
jgi:hypothetical protein